MTQYLLSVHGPATYDEALNDASAEDMKKAFADVEASKACQGKVEVRPFESQ